MSDELHNSRVRIYNERMTRFENMEGDALNDNRMKMIFRTLIDLQRRTDDILDILKEDKDKPKGDGF